MKIKKGFKGSTLILTIIFIAVMFVMSVGLIELAMSSLKVSKGYYAKNRAYYDAESAFERVVYYLDMVADKARQMANDYVFLDSGVLNTQHPDVADILKEYQQRESQYYIDYVNGTITKAQYDAAMDSLKQDYEKKVKEKFLSKFKEYIGNFFTNSGTVDERPRLEFTVSGFTYTIDNWKSSNNDLYSFMQMIDFNNPDVKVNIEFDPVNNMNLHTSPLEIEQPIDMTMYVGVDLLKEKTKRVLRVDFNIFPYKSGALNFTSRTIKRSFNRILDYTIFAGKNLILLNNSSWFNVKKGKVYVRGTANDVRVSNPSENFGGILAGITVEQLNNLSSGARINPIDSSTVARIQNILGTSSSVSGNINIDNADVYVGYSDTNPDALPSATFLRDKYALYGGFIKTCAQNSNITVNGNVYCHSIVTENTAQNSNISIGGNAYIMDNVSMYAKDSNINISNSLIGMSAADTPYNYNSSASIVINEDTAKLTIGRNVVLMGAAFVDEVHRIDEEGKEKLFRMPESSSLIPNFTIYQYFNLPPSDLQSLLSTLGLNEAITGDLFRSDYFKPYKVKVSSTEEVDVDLYDMEVATPDKAVNFVLHYLVANKKDPDNFDTPYNMGASNISIGGGNVNFNPSNPYDTSYFEFLLNANGKLYLGKKIGLVDVGEIQNTIGSGGTGEFVDLSETVTSNEAFKNAVTNNVVDPKREEFFSELNLVNKGLLDNSKDRFLLEDFVDFDALNSDRLVLYDNKNLIIISKNNIEEIDFGLPAWNGIPISGVENVLIVTKGSLILRNSDTNAKSLKGNIIAGGDIVISGNGDLTIEYSKGVSAQLMYYFNYANFDSDADKLGQLYNFFIKGIDTSDIVEIPFVTTFYESTVKTNIKVKGKRQIVSN